MKRTLHLFHRWAGIVLCAFFAAWFFSGIFMMYVEYPQLTRAERLVTAPALAFAPARLSVAAAADTLRAGDFNRRGTPSKNLPVEIKDPSARLGRDPAVRLAQILDRPAYVFTDGTAQPVVVFADTGEKLPVVTIAQAARAAAVFAKSLDARPPTLNYLGTVQSDQWAVSAALNAHRPLHVFALNDAAHTELYVSSTTGEVVRDSTRRERVLNYFAAVIHWLYPHLLRQFPDAWAWFVNSVAALGCILAITGLWAGVLRARRRVPAPRNSHQRLLRWHYVAGAAFGLVTLTWVFSGWMSMNPGKLNPPRSPSPRQAEVLSGRAPSFADFATPPVLPPGALDAEPLYYDGQPLYVVTPRDGTTILVPAFPGTPLRAPDAEALIARAPALLPGAPLVEARVLTAYDNYYYTRHPERGGSPLPAVRVRFGDADATWFHLDPATGRILNKSTATNRVFRHLYNGLHSFDWWWLWSRRPLWDITVITFSLGGLSLSLLGVVLGLRRMRIELAPRKPTPASASSALAPASVT